MQIANNHGVLQSCPELPRSPKERACDGSLFLLCHKGQSSAGRQAVAPAWGRGRPKPQQAPSQVARSKGLRQGVDPINGAALREFVPLSAIRTGAVDAVGA